MGVARRALILWAALAVAAVMLGAARETLLEPRLGEQAARGVTTLAMAAVLLAVVWLAVPWLSPDLDRGELTKAGASWAGLSAALHLVIGLVVARAPLGRVLADYDFLAGRLWALLLLVLLLGPPVIGALRARRGRG